MEIGVAGLMKIAEMICGDSPFDFFPYRSSSNLTRFFIDLDLDYVHDGSTRRHWVNDALKELSAKKQNSDNMPSSEIVKVIEYLLHPDHFLFDERVDRDKAVEAIQACLKTYDLTVTTQPNGLVKLVPTHGEFVSTDHPDVPTEKLVTFKPSVFDVPNKPQNPKLISVMMPFSASFSGTYTAIQRVIDHMSLECVRANSIWDNSTFIQDIFDII